MPEQSPLSQFTAADNHALVQFEQRRPAYGRRMLMAFDDLNRAREHGTSFDMVGAIAECLRAVVPPTIERHGALCSTIALPGLDVSHYYLGVSESLGRVKLGLSGDVRKREASLRRSQIGLGFPGDFEMCEWVTGEAKRTRQLEREGLKHLSAHRVGGEWFVSRAEVWDWHHHAGNVLTADLAARVRAIDIESQISQAMVPFDRGDPFGTLQALHPVSAEGARARNLARLISPWFRALDRVMGMTWETRHG